MSAPIAPLNRNLRRLSRRGAKHPLIALLAVAGVAAFSSAPANAAPRTNNDLANATAISAVPPRHAVDINGVATEPGSRSTTAAARR
jgi:hypothetical protein